MTTEPDEAEPRAARIVTVPRWSVAVVAVVVPALVAGLVWALVRPPTSTGITVEPLATTCGSKVFRYGSPGDVEDDFDGITGFGLSDRDIARSTQCTVYVRVRNDRSSAIHVDGYRLAYLGSGSGGPLEAVDQPRLWPDVRTVRTTDAWVDDPFEVPAGEWSTISWRVRLRPGQCTDAGRWGAPLISLDVDGLGEVDSGLTFSIRVTKALDC